MLCNETLQGMEKDSIVSGASGNYRLLNTISSGAYGNLLKCVRTDDCSKMILVAKVQEARHDNESTCALRL